MKIEENMIRRFLANCGLRYFLIDSNCTGGGTVVVGSVGMLAHAKKHDMARH